MTRLLVLRHGQTAWNAEERIQGQSDIDLDEAGAAQAAEAAKHIATFQPVLLVSSDLRRAANTATALAAVTGLDISYDPRLRERDYGSWQGLSVREIEERYPADFARWRAGSPLTDLGFESVDEVAKRATAAMREAADRTEGGCAVVVTHGHSGKAGLVGMLGWPQSVAYALGGLENCHYAELRHTSARDWQLRAYNVGPC